MYQETKPSERLSNLIDSFWTFSNNEASENFKVLPDNCCDLIFDLKQNKGFLSGIMSNYQLREIATASDLIGIRFKTEKFGSLSKIPLNETKNLRVELSEIFPSKNLDIFTQLIDLETTTDKINFLESSIESIFKENFERQDQMILSVAQNIRLMNGSVTIGDLANSHHISLRQLERRFKKSIGLTVKEFSSIVRFNTAKKSIGDFAKTSLLEIAYDGGFFDHSHMTNEFNRISGENPSYFR